MSPSSQSQPEPGSAEPSREHANARERHETAAERLDRNWNELLQELRVSQTGVQVLFAFLLVLPFQSRFGELDPFDRELYLVVVLLVALSTVLNLAPVVIHRVLFARHQKDVLVRVSGPLAVWSLATLGCALVGALALVVDVVAGARPAAVVSGGLALLLLVLWAVVPLALRRRERPSSTYDS